MTRQKKINFLIISLILLLLFAFLSYLVKKNVFVHMDFDTTVRLQNHLSRKFDFPFSFFSLLGSVELTGILLFGIFLFIFIKKKRLFVGLVLFFIILLAELLGKLFIFHPGPPYMFFRYDLGFSFPSSYLNTNYSYPSGHTARTAFIIIIMTFLIHRFSKSKFKNSIIYLLLFLFSIVMFISRIYLGEHWFSDVLGGILLGGSLGNLAIALW